MSNSSDRMLVFTGADLKGVRALFLQRFHSQGYTVLPLDVAAIGATSAASVPYTLLDEWLDVTAMKRAYDQANYCERNWYASAQAEFTSQGICWPEFDHHSMHWFWIEVAFAEAIAECCRVRNVKELTCLASPTRQPTVYYEPGDIRTSLWLAELPGVARMAELDDSELRQSVTLRNYLGKGYRRGRRYLRNFLTPPERSVGSGPAITSTDISGKIVLAINKGEAYRFRTILATLRETYPDRLAGIVLSPDPEIARQAQLITGVPFYPGPSVPSAAVLSTAQRNCKALGDVTTGAKEAPWFKALQHLSFHFDYYCGTRWPRLSVLLDAWGALWSTCKPAAVLVSNLMDAESQLPAAAANQIGIPTLSVPHGAGMTRLWDKIAAKRVLCDSAVQYSIYQGSGIHPQRLQPCRSLITPHEYPATSPHPWPTGPAQRRLLVLTDPIGFPGFIATSISPNSQMQLLRCLTQPPPDVATRISLRIKVHPGWPDLALFEAISPQLTARVFPLTTDLDTVLADVDLVVCANYCGGALVHAIRAHKPIIFFWNDPCFRQNEPHYFANLYLPSGTLVCTANELWAAIRRWLSEPGCADEMHQRSREFWQKQMDDSRYPTLAELLTPTLNDNQILRTITQ